MRKKLIMLALLAATAGAATAQISVGIGLPHVSIGVNLPLYPDLVPVPGYPVYYAPHVEGNYFFYDGMYWVYEGDDWYVSSWYNGPWGRMDRDDVPSYVLRIPVRYYQRPPQEFRHWQREAAPHWNEHWGNEWAQHHAGWDRHERGPAPARPPLPVYQRQYSGDRYPHAEQQRVLEDRNYRYQPRDPVVRQRHEEMGDRKPEVRHEPYRESRPDLKPAVQRPEQHERSAPPPQEYGHREQKPEHGEHGDHGHDKHDERNGK